MANDRWIKNIRETDGHLYAFDIEIGGAATSYIVKREMDRRLMCNSCKRTIKDGRYFIFAQFQMRLKNLKFFITCDECTTPVREAIDKVLHERG